MYTHQELTDLFKQFLKKEQVVKAPKGLYEPIDYGLKLGGKRMRPTLLLLAYNLFKDKVEDVLYAALAVETYHNFTLLHDDVMDDSDIRRGKPTVHKVWDTNTAILSGDAMLILAQKYLSKVDNPKFKEALMEFLKVTMEVCEGQQYDIEFETRDDVKEEDYLGMIRLKTAVLLASSISIGAILGGASDSDRENLYHFGINLGLSFQLQDDLLDVYGDPKVFGKKLGGDIVSNKKTFMFINAFERANSKQRAELSRWVDASTFDPDAKIEAVRKIYDDINIKKVCEDKMMEFYSTAEAYLDKVDVEDSKKNELKRYMGFLMNREL